MIVTIGIICALIFILLIKVFYQARHKNAVQQNIEEKKEIDAGDENVTADKLPANEWLEMAEKYLALGNLKFAVRAFFLAALSALNQRGMINIRAFKSNYEYYRELKDKSHIAQNLVFPFFNVISFFDKIWYGDYEIKEIKFGEYKGNINLILNENEYK